MKTLIGATMLSLLALGGLSGCTNIPGAMASGGGTGEAWYTKNTYLGSSYGGLLLSSKVYYCDGKTPVCRQADMQ